MPKILQLFQWHAVIPKNDYTPETRKNLAPRENHVSRSGFLETDSLFLPDAYGQSSDIPKAGWIVLNDVVGDLVANAHQATSSVWVFPKTLRQIKLGAIQLVLNEAGDWEVWKDHVSSLLESPGEIFKLADLHVNDPIRIQANFRSDFSMTGRRDRVYHESEWIIEWLDSPDDLPIEFLAPNRIERLKVVPVDRCKVVDLRKRFY